MTTGKTNTLLLRPDLRKVTRKRPKLGQGPEDLLQKACVSYARLVLGPSVRLHHSVNEGKRSIVAAVLAKDMGQLAGFPDLIIMWPFGRVGFIELKAPKGVFSKDQKDFRAWAECAGHLWAEVRDIIEFKAVLKGWGVPHKGGIYHGIDRA